MTHINDEILDVYAQCGSFTDEEKKLFESHLQECSSCRMRFNELKDFYAEIERMDDSGITFKDVESELKEIQSKRINTLEDIFAPVKIPLKHTSQNIFERLLKKTLTGIRNYFYIKVENSPAYPDTGQRRLSPFRLVYATSGSIAILTVALILILKGYQKEYLYQQKQTALKDTSANYLKTIYPKDSIRTGNENYTNNDITSDKSEDKNNNNERKPEKVRQKSGLFAIVQGIVPITTISKGETPEAFGFIGSISKKDNALMLSVYDYKDFEKEYKGKGKINFMKERNEKYFIEFPKAEMNSGNKYDFDSIRMITDIDGYTVTVGDRRDTSGTKNIIYKFNKDMRIENVEFTKSFKEEYMNMPDYETGSENKLKEKLKTSLKYWNGKEFINEYIENPDAKND